VKEVPPSDSGSELDPVQELAEEFLERQRRGERPTVAEYAWRYPQWADRIGKVFRALALLEVARPAEASGPVAGRAACPAGPELQCLGDFRMLREVGRGGMGVVYEAEQVSLGRRVALKVLLQRLPDDRARRRFEREAKAAAKLHHTNIVPVFGVGEDDGLPYYAMQFIQGLGLDEVLRELKRLQSGSKGGGNTPHVFHKEVSAADIAHSLVTGKFAPPEGPAGTVDHAPDGVADQDPRVTPPGAGRQSDATPLSSTSAVLPGAGKGRATYWQSVARIGVQVADALEHAHRQGILHRDVKPSNLLLDAAGTIWVTDFGLARADDQQNLTRTGDVLGTYRYMPPEAFDGKADARSDIYSLGLTLYELLVLRPAFDEADRNKLIKQVTEAVPPRPGKLNRAVPRDLETIVHKAIDREPGRRYRTAAELAADLQRFLDDAPIQARRVSLAERLWRWGRRNPLPAGMAALILALTLGGIGGILWQWQKAEHAHRTTVLTLADMHTAAGLAAGARDDPRQAVLWFAEAARLAGDDRERAEDNRIRAAAWGRLAIQPVRAFKHPCGWVENNMAFHPGGRHLLTHGFDPTTEKTDCWLWDLEREEALSFPGNPGEVSAAAWDDTGKYLAVGTPQGEVTIYSFPNGEKLQRVPLAGRITRVLFSPDGRYCALAAGNRARVWDCRQKVFVTPELRHPEPVATLAFHPQGELLATGCQDQFCRVFAVPAEKDTLLFEPVPHRWEAPSSRGSPFPPLFLDEGRGLLTAGEREPAWRDPRTGEIRRKLEWSPLNYGGYMITVALSGDGRYLLLAGRSFDQQQARLYDVASARPVSANLEHRTIQAPMSAAFSPDGQTLLTGSGDSTARRWSVPEGKPLGSPLTHPAFVNAVAYSPNGHHLATAQPGGLIRLWALPLGNPRDYRVPVGSWSFFRLSRDGRLLLPTGLSHHRCSLRSTQVFDLTTSQPAGPKLDANGIIMDAAFAPDGQQVAAAVASAASPQERDSLQPGQLLLWDWRTGKLQHKPLPLPSEPRTLDYSPDGKKLAVICARYEVVLIDPAKGTMLRPPWQEHKGVLGSVGWYHNGAVRFSPDGRSLLTFPIDKAVHVWDVDTGQFRHKLRLHDWCNAVEFSPDGKLVATASRDRQVCVWELTTGRQLKSLIHPSWAEAAVFSPDGEQLLTACGDYMARLWDWREGRLVCPPFQHEHALHAVAFRPDGRHVLSASSDGILKISERRTGKPVCPPLRLGGVGLSLAVTPAGRVVCGGFLNDLPVFHLADWLAPSPLRPDELCLWGEVLSGQRVEAGGGVTNLTADEWLERWRDFRRRRPDWGTR
jgi:WD40 repeat protein/serine/threonine protein kinase